MTNILSGVTAQPYTLVIVDMQPGFSAANDERTINGVLDEIRSAIALGAPVVLIESDRAKYGKTHNVLLDALASYNPDLWTVETKFWRYGDDYSPHSGALQVDEACEVFGFTTRRFRVCGVNTDICVFFTAMQLGKRFPATSLEIVMRACNVPDIGFEVDTEKAFRYYAGVHAFTNYQLV
jgi:nicotinamidase-related amidase